MRPNQKELACGAVFAGVGLVYGAIALTTLPVGRALAMGPGYFPLLICVVLIGVGGAILLRAFRLGGESVVGLVPWRGIACIAAATLFFAFCFERVGIFPTVFVSTLLAYAASRSFRLVEAVAAGLVVAVLCTGVFGYLLQLPVPILASPFGD